MTVLILGGTGEARSLAVALDGTDIAFESSLAGRSAIPACPSVRCASEGSVARTVSPGT